MSIPSINTAREILEEAGKLNPGQWLPHSMNAAEAARSIAANHPELDADTAYVLALLHDIGRRSGVHQMRHIIDGYNYMQKMGYSSVARICLTHSFPVQDLKVAAGKWDCSCEEYEFIENYIKGIDYNNYDRLVQLCDYLALPNGFSLVETRMIDVALRYGTNAYSVQKWKQILSTKQYFEAAIGCSVYSLLPGVFESTISTKFKLD
ncbi:MAG: HD domain-containing protein [Clostridia bacterium]|nr:HD domain-containing protein [Clostridia bacterium]